MMFSCQEDIKSALDEKYGKNDVYSKIVLLCTHPDPNQRPTFSTISIVLLNKNVETKLVEYSGPLIAGDIDSNVDDDEEMEDCIVMTEDVSKQWEESPVKLLQKKAYHAAVAISKYQILLTGGFNGISSLDPAELITIDDDNKIISTSTSAIPKLRSGRCGHASVVVKNYAYLIGGADRSNNDKSVLRINLNDRQSGWENVTSMKQARFCCAAATHNGIIYAFGGMDENYRRVSTVEVFDTANPDGEWKLLNNAMSKERSSHCVVTIGDLFFVIGGGLNSVEVFDTTTQSFRNGPPLPIPISESSAITVGKFIIAIGGWDCDRRKYIRESYLLDTAAVNPQWVKIDVPLQTPRDRHTAVVVDDKLWVCGGHADGYLDSIESIQIAVLLPNVKVNAS